MLLRPTGGDVGMVVRITGHALHGLGAATVATALVGLAAGQPDAASALGVGGGLTAGIGAVLRRSTAAAGRQLSWTQGVVAATASWIACSLSGAVPLYLSGHYAGYLDAVFDTLSGLTTTGLTVVQDLDHLPWTMQGYRIGLQLAGGIAVVVVGLGLLTAPTATGSSLRPSDVRDERVLPHPARTWRQATTIVAGISGLGAVACTAAVVAAGIPIGRAVLHGPALAASAAVTGGFAPTSASVRYYHSFGLELVLLPVMLAGATSFAIHLAAGRGRVGRRLGEFELRVLAATMVGLLAATLVGLGRAGTYTEALPLLRHGLFATVSAHTTTGLQTTTPQLVGSDWGRLAPAALVAAMTLGGMTGSSAGGLKALRVGIVVRGVIGEVRRVLLPEATYLATSFRQGHRRILTDAHVRSAATMVLLMLSATLAGAVVWMFVDPTMPLTQALFTTTSAATNGGLSLETGTTDLAAPVKLGLMLLMLLGRLEWLAVFAAAGFVWAGMRGRR